jgi:hypothetical protein
VPLQLIGDCLQLAAIDGLDLDAGQPGDLVEPSSEGLAHHLLQHGGIDRLDLDLEQPPVAGDERRRSGRLELAGVLVQAEGL